MANPLYGQNKQDELLDSLAGASESIDTSLASGAGKLGAADVVADAAIPVTINGVEYVLPLYTIDKIS